MNAEVGRVEKTASGSSMDKNDVIACVRRQPDNAFLAVMYEGAKGRGTNEHGENSARF
jgi:hypothetical protein